MVAPTCFGITLPSSENVSSAFWEMLNWGSEFATHHVTRHNKSIHNILSTAPQVSIYQKALGTLPVVGYVMPKHELQKWYTNSDCTMVSRRPVFRTLTYLDCYFILKLSPMVYIIRLFSTTTQMITRILSRSVNTEASHVNRNVCM
jgi:hypothetical protein